MPDKFDYLNHLADMRESYKDYVEAVDADLAVERQKRLAQRQGEIVDAVVNAYAHGATKAELKRAYGTKDHKTITNIIESSSNQIEVIQTKVKPVAPIKDWFTIHDDLVDIEGDTYNVITLEDDEFMLDGTGLPRDGDVLDYTATGGMAELFKALLEAKNA